MTGEVLKPKISIVIPARNEEKYIPDTIGSINEQDYDNKKIIIVPNDCDDKTAEISEKELKRHGMDFEIFPTKKKGISHAKNIGIEKSDGDLIVTLDADTLMGPDLLKEIYNSLYETVYVGGKVKIRPRLDDLSKKDRTAARALFAYANFWNSVTMNFSNISNYLNRIKQSGAGACMFLDRETIEKIEKEYGKPFNEDLETMEDVDFTQRMRKQGKIKFLNKSYVETDMRRYLKGKGFLGEFLSDAFQFMSPKGKKREFYR